MDYSKILRFYFFVTFMCFATIKAQGSPTFLYNVCSGNKTTANSTFHVNLMTLLSSLSSKSISNMEFYSTTATAINASDSVYGLFMCRGDVSSQLCHECVGNATQTLFSDTDCSLSNRAVIWYDECMVRYSNNSFFSMVATSPGVFLMNTANVSNPKSFMPLLSSTMNETAEKAASLLSSYSNKMFATNESEVSKFQTLYCLVQCTPDLSPNDCRTCLSSAIEYLPQCCDGKQGGRVLFPSCNIRYELYPFYSSVNASSPNARVPETNDSKEDAGFTQDPFYLDYNCPGGKSTITQKNFKLLLSYLSSNATSNKFSLVKVEDKVYGLFMCRGDLPPGLCERCVKNATDRIYSSCHSSPEGIIWYSHCLLRYSNRNFFSDMKTSPMYRHINTTTYSFSDQNLFTSKLSNQLSQQANDTGDTVERYLTRSSKLNDVQTLYTLEQCTRDLSGSQCSSCLSDIISSSIPWSFLGSVGGRIIYPSCNLRFELFQFYDDVGEAQSPESPPLGNKEKWRIVAIVVAIIISVILFSIGYYYFLRRKGRKSRRTILRENFGEESASLEPMRFDWVTIQAATNNFSKDNYIGKGGFGEVYKGILQDGRAVAIKRLSINSKQGVEEFKNEVLLIAKLQHRNLVIFIGFCLEEHEKILIYEFVPNKSLDYFLFDSQCKKLLTWAERFNIIGGIVRGILYMHEHSRLKVIHRDLKPSNILLDENMIPKISDFGLARIVEISQDEGTTNRIVGTYGYMSPEYGMLGQFSEKSDIYSFGVMLLEIIAGRKNMSSYTPHHGAEGVNGLLNYVWRQWKDQTPLSILDPNIKDDYSKIEVTKCIQIGLLCVQHNPDARPSMVTIVSYLSSYSIELPTPQEPIFFSSGRTNSKSDAQESNSAQSANSSSLFSMNEMSITNFIPR
ncbi:cysteine-rich receptor-like protein kinase 25 [Vicia villosa]|uniref:cysteine-rich receptor-like protein kinase 25 n=1 Tax=Vicia villosa TaxID=3911 RepID=UPI00273AE7C4|nr:cysteine-rich receptor-like protein kinase 25 [Vicia villosa]